MTAAAMMAQPASTCKKSADILDQRGNREVPLSHLVESGIEAIGIGAGKGGKCSGIVVDYSGSGCSAKVQNSSTGEAIAAGINIGDITSQMGHFGVAITNGTINTKRVTKRRGFCHPIRR